MHTQAIGIIGIGQIGLSVASNLLQSGFRVVGFSRTVPKEFEQRGGVKRDNPAQVTQEANVLLLCLPDEAAQSAVLDGPNGVLLSWLRNQVDTSDLIL
jgi:3-hydroxyisobutyrate dehydrogenase-like beta-hydroxyacid dehydrogenase